MPYVSSYCVGYETYVEDMWFICPYAVDYDVKFNSNKCVVGPTICPCLCKLTFDLLTLKVVSESRLTQATSVPILVFLGLTVLDLRPNVRNRQTDVTDRRQTCIIVSCPYPGAGHNKSVAMHIDPRYDALCASSLSWLVIIFAMLHQLNTWALCLMQVFFGYLIDHIKWLFIVFLTAYLINQRLLILKL